MENLAHTTLTKRSKRNRPAPRKWDKLDHTPPDIKEPLLSSPTKMNNPELSGGNIQQTQTEGYFFKVIDLYTSNMSNS